MCALANSTTLACEVPAGLLGKSDPAEGVLGLHGRVGEPADHLVVLCPAVLRVGFAVLRLGFTVSPVDFADLGGGSE